MNNSLRYQRQIQVPQIAQTGQLAIHNARILVVGMGGLGCVVAPYLVGAGVKAITLVDNDTVALSNLHRQTLYNESDLGKSKAEVSSNRLKQQNSTCDIQFVSQRCHAGNVSSLVASADVVVDAADNFAVSYLLSDTCLTVNKPLVSASVNRTYGYIGTFCFNGLPSYRAVFPNVPRAGGCDTVGVLGPSVGAVGSLQAQQVLKTIVEQCHSAVLWQLDLWDFSIVEIDTSDSKEPIWITPFVSEKDVGDKLVIDVREAAEVEAAPLNFRNVVAIPLRHLESTFQQYSDKNIVFACRSGQRALHAAQMCQDSSQAELSVVIPAS